MRNELMTPEKYEVLVKKAARDLGVVMTPVGLSADWNTEAWRVATDNSGEDYWGLFIVDQESWRNNPLACYSIIERNRIDETNTDNVIASDLSLRAAIAFVADLLSTVTDDEWEAHKTEQGNGEPIHISGCECIDCTGGRCGNKAPLFYMAF